VEPNTTLVTLVHQEYFTNTPTEACTNAILEFIEQTPERPGLDEHIIKRVLKISFRIPANRIFPDHLARLHGYAHHVANDLQDRSDVKKLYAHLHRDAANIVRKQYWLTQNISLAQEAIKDYRVAALSADARKEPGYVVATLTERLRLSVKVGEYLRSPDIIDDALQELARFPKAQVADGDLRHAKSTIDYARTVAARIRRSTAHATPPQRF